ncbi:choice-of-anchor D domain-containing protein [Herbiconiux moechotypicola]|uniref:Gram-positive cocci surface proteins LPxTG domain-containing protein n=1 Tax=Herbiconiux moechotypicola TaxID=637393 RepID=A0ABN3DBH7_9MICO|nr:choice-of-anchor D domain-containing protein [Herbiconiux moechotypicola]MCS5728873.1 choice-of-anchor D domain-containing protein [Herbiconiux moechotypicola]
MPVPFSRRRPRAFAALAAAVLAGTALGGLALVVPAASAVPGDPTSISLSGPGSDFGAVKTGTTVTRTLTLLNDGTGAIMVDPAPLSALAAPFTLVSTTLDSMDFIEAGTSRTFTVKYTAPAVGTDSMQIVTLTAKNIDGVSPSSTLPIKFAGRSLATDRSFFVVTGPDGAAKADFGTTPMGTAVDRALTITVQGIDDLSFSIADISIADGSGAPLTSVAVGASDFGVGTKYKPGQSASFTLRFTPAATGPVTGTVTVAGRQMNGDPEAPNVVVQVPITAFVEAAVDPEPTPTPTPTDAPTPGPTTTPATPTPGSTTPTTGGSGGSGTGSQSSGTASSGSTTGVASRATSSLAQTGAEATIPAVIVAAGFLAAGLLALQIVRRRRRA